MNFAVQMMKQLISSNFNPAPEPKTDFDDLRNCTDLHCWVVHNGKIVDYTLKQLLTKSPVWGTDELVYVPFAMPLQRRVFDVIRQRYKNTLTKLRRELSKAELEATYAHWDNVAGHCWMKAIRYYKKHHRDGATLVFGSLGFVQPNGSVFYEYG